MKKNKKSKPSARQGFTLIELLIVIAIIGILAGIVLMSASLARSRGIIGAFKKETRGQYADMATKCLTEGTAMAIPNDTKYTNWGSAFTIPCTTRGTFAITAQPNSGTSSQINCTASITESGASYSGAECGT